jgi:hypothetical protein
MHRQPWNPKGFGRGNQRAMSCKCLRWSLVRTGGGIENSRTAPSKAGCEPWRLRNHGQVVAGGHLSVAMRRTASIPVRQERAELSRLLGNTRHGTVATTTQRLPQGWTPVAGCDSQHSHPHAHLGAAVGLQAAQRHPPVSGARSWKHNSPTVRAAALRVAAHGATSLMRSAARPSRSAPAPSSHCCSSTMPAGRRWSPS